MRVGGKYGIALIASIVSITLYLNLAYFLSRSTFLELIISIAALFGAYFLLLKESKGLSENFNLGLGMAFRLIFLLSLPVLSDDFYRFIWDGQLVNHGIDPYRYLPTQVEFDLPLKEQLLAEMNSPEYFSVYPPFLQYLFAISTALDPSRILSSVVFMRFIILLADLGSFFLIKRILKQLELSPKRALIYFFNPLVIIELTGNLHFEAVMIFFSLLAIHWAIKNKLILSACSLSLAFLTKLIPLLLLPLMWRNGDRNSRFVLIAAFIISTLLLSWPLMDIGSITGIASSLDLYVQKFEFNASVYYLFRYLGFLWTGYNIIQALGPILMLLTVLGVIYLLFVRTQENLKVGMKHLLFALSLYYLFSTTVHPWYISFILLIGLFTNYLYPLIWSLLAFLSYAAYSSVQISYWILLLEYAPLYILLFYEFRNKGVLAKYFQERVSLHDN